MSRSTETAGSRGGNWRDERAFHPAHHAEHKKKCARPDEGSDAALRAEHGEQKEQRCDQQKTHELFHPYHPWARFGQKFEPGGLCA